jgi:hypothetical protein
MDVVDAVEFLHGSLLERHVAVIVARVIDQKVETRRAEFGEGVFHAADKGVERRDVACIELQRDGLRIHRFRDDCLRVRSVGVIGENRVDSPPREALDDIAADAATSAGYDCDLARHSFAPVWLRWFVARKSVFKSALGTLGCVYLSV